jgi:hypothetical protein
MNQRSGAAVTGLVHFSPRAEDMTKYLPRDDFRYLLKPAPARRLPITVNRRSIIAMKGRYRRAEQIRFGPGGETRQCMAPKSRQVSGRPDGRRYPCRLTPHPTSIEEETSGDVTKRMAVRMIFGCIARPLFHQAFTGSLTFDCNA